MELVRGEKLDRRAKHGPEHAVESFRGVLPRESDAPAAAQNGSPVRAGELRSKRGEPRPAFAREDLEERLPHAAGPGERLPGTLRRPLRAGEESALFPGGENARLPRPGGEVGVGLEEILPLLGRTIVHGIGEIETEPPSAELEKAPSPHWNILDG
jgi:hypothetical protein